MEILFVSWIKTFSYTQLVCQSTIHLFHLETIIMREINNCGLETKLFESFQPDFLLGLFLLLLHSLCFKDLFYSNLLQGNLVLLLQILS